MKGYFVAEVCCVCGLGGGGGLAARLVVVDLTIELRARF